MRRPYECASPPPRVEREEMCLPTKGLNRGLGMPAQSCHATLYSELRMRFSHVGAQLMKAPEKGSARMYAYARREAVFFH